MILRLAILATAMVGCVPNTDNLQLGSGDLSVKATTPGGDSKHWPVASAWAEPYSSTTFGAGGSINDGFGAFAITFSGETTHPTPPACRDRQLLAQDVPQLSLQTQSKGTPSLATGDLPFQTNTNVGTLVDTRATYAKFDILAIGINAIYIDAGHVTITASDDEHITGTFEASGLESYWSEETQTGGTSTEQIVGYFDVPICWN
jgi:hypothetical protein